MQRDVSPADPAAVASASFLVRERLRPDRAASSMIVPMEAGSMSTSAAFAICFPEIATLTTVDYGSGVSSEWRVGGRGRGRRADRASGGEELWGGGLGGKTKTATVSDRRGAGRAGEAETGRGAEGVGAGGRAGGWRWAYEVWEYLCSEPHES